MSTPPEQPHDSAPESALAEALARAARGEPYKAVLERLLRAVAPAQADAWMLHWKESRGAWTLYSGLARGARVLFVGDALSGTVTALAFLGFRVVVADADARRLRFARVRDAALESGRAGFVLARADALPFPAGAFELVVAELDGGRAACPPVLKELARVAQDEVAVVGDNRLAYKRSVGRRGRFHVPGPLEWTRRALRPDAGERTPRGYRRALARSGFPVAHGLALYPHAREFSHVVALDAPVPRLTIGPKERQNRLKVWARAAGLFPLLTPSLALVGRRAPARPRLERVLDALAERLGEPRAQAEHLVATRSNVAVVLTTPRDAPEACTGPGAWSLHVPLGPHKAGMVRRHFGFLERVRRDFPGVPVPEPLFLGEVEGVLVACERRLPGLSAPHFTGDERRTARMLTDVRAHLRQLVVEPARPCDEERFERLVGDRYRMVAALCAVPSTERRIARMLDEARERLAGERFPLVLYHADLRSKHVQVDGEGGVLGYLDWGASEEAFLPYVDLIHLIGHQRKAEARAGEAEAWQVFLEGRLRPAERAALDAYAADLSLPAGLVETVEAHYPLFVAGMAERNWDFSRPRWVHSQFGL